MCCQPAANWGPRPCLAGCVSHGSCGTAPARSSISLSTMLACNWTLWHDAVVASYNCCASLQMRIRAQQEKHHLVDMPGMYGFYLWLCRS